MDKKDELLHEFARLTTPETVAAPTFQQSGSRNMLICVRGDGNAVQTCPGVPEDTLGRILRTGKPWARRWTALWVVLALFVAALACWSDYRRSGEHGWRALNAWMLQHDPHFVLTVFMLAAAYASLAIILWMAWRRQRRD